MLGIGNLPRVRAVDLPRELLYEDWQDGFVDASEWQYTIDNSGTVEALLTGGQNGRNAHANIATGGTSGSTARLMSRKPIFIFNSGQTALTTFVERCVLEFNAVLGDGADRIDNAAAFYGASVTQAATKATDNSFGFYFASDVLRAFVDRDAVETTSALTNAINITILHKYRIEVDRVNEVRFFVDDVLEATITTNTPEGKGAMYLVWNNKNDQALGNALVLGETRLWMEDII